MNTKTNLEKQAIAERIAHIALDMFATQSFQAISINAIAKKSQVAKGTVFNYFKTKENIFMYLLLTGYQDFFTETLATFQQQKITTLPAFKQFMLDNTEHLITEHLTLIKLNALRGPILEGKANMQDTIVGRQKLYKIHQSLAHAIHQKIPSINVHTANKLFIIQSSIISGLINLSHLDTFNQQPLTADFNDFQVSVHDDALQTFALYLTGIFQTMKEEK